MALISCPECATQVSDKAVSCPSCGCPISKQIETPYTSVAPRAVTVSKSRGVYIILGIVFGGLGFHNFYSGHNVSGGIKCGILLLAFAVDASTHFYSAFSLIALVFSELWSLVDVMIVSTDAAGNNMS